MTRQHAQQIWPIIKAYGEGKKIEFNTNGASECWIKLREPDNVLFDSPASRYRIARPDLPPGEQWSNPEKLTPEQIGEGYRPLTVREHEEGYYSFAEFCDHIDDNTWLYHKDSFSFKDNPLRKDWTYRVPADTPFLLPDTKPIPDLPLTSTPQGTITEVAALLRQAATLLEAIKP
jgi:hypothetical protein